MSPEMQDFLIRMGASLLFGIVLGIFIGVFLNRYR
jgi:hypothetical protein